ncbi:amyloid-beta A4 precursor protein-binding family B member 2 isoform X4 [Callorhinchus milii]|uniref:amyloid-beta A4 precursor protein-binding family B member 2 isoform X4 n=1 Tax=Callorhinchus milii TaxID=7868 RepID=UPI001C3FB859|nr:amyloid-beta A4 precursor protein-binding family B member 2 isoform X4 [Callorhinchus milii]
MGRRYPGAFHRPHSTFDSTLDSMSVFLATSNGQTDVANRNGSSTPPNTLNLRSSHNELVNAEIKNSTPPKCRKKYALTNIEAAMGLGDMPPPPVPVNNSANSKLAKNGENQLRKAAEQGQQDMNRNISGNVVKNIISEKLEGKEANPQDVPSTEAVASQPRKSKSFLNYYVDLESATQELVQNQSNSPTTSEERATQSHTESASSDEVLASEESASATPEDCQMATISSSPEGKKDPPRPGGRADFALSKMQNLIPSDEDSSWTTLSQDSVSLTASPDETDIWSDQSFQTDPDLPPGWKKINDVAGTYYWHIPTGTTQWERPISPTAQVLEERKGSLSSITPSPTPESEKPWTDFAVLNGGKINSDIWKDLHAATENPDPSLKEFEGATLRYASLKLRTPLQAEEDDSCTINSDPEAKCFAVRSLGWVEMAEEDLAPGKSSVAVNNCIRQLSYCKNDIRDTVGIWGEGKDMYLILENNMLDLIDPMDRTILHSQPIVSIRVWGVGRDNGRERDFAYVARDKDTRILKCHVFRCDTPAKAIATSLHEICSKIMAERRTAKAVACSVSQERVSVNLEVPLQDFPTPKTELVQKFHVQYLGMLPVAKPLGIEILNGAIDSLLATTNKADWLTVIMNVADATVTVIRQKNEDEVLLECRVRFLSFIGVGKDIHSFAFIMDTGNQRYESHVFWCEPNAGNVSEAVQAACMLRYQKCLVARPPPPRMCSSGPPTDSVTRRVTTSVKRGVLSLIDTLKQKQPVSESP